MTCMGRFQQPELNKEQAMVFSYSYGEALGQRNSYVAFLAPIGAPLSPFVTLKQRRRTHSQSRQHKQQAKTENIGETKRQTK